jgi:hypothetical protein
MINGELSGFAEIVAKRFIKGCDFSPPDDVLRDICDMQTGGELDTFQLDLLTDMVTLRLKKAWAIKVKEKPNV